MLVVRVGRIPSFETSSGPELLQAPPLMLALGKVMAADMTVQEKLKMRS